MNKWQSWVTRMRIQTGSTVFSKHNRGLTFFNKGLEITDIMRYNINKAFSSVIAHMTIKKLEWVRVSKQEKADIMLGV